jgi:hypothetical protein
LLLRLIINTNLPWDNAIVIFSGKFVNFGVVILL